VAAQQAQIDRLKDETAAVRALQRQVDEIRGLVDGIRNTIGGLLP